MNRRSKKLLLKVLDPLDALVRRINGKQHYPPLHLRWEVGPLRGFETAGAEYRLLLKLAAGLRPDSSLLDIGCGCGQMALWLANDLDEHGRYEGWDLHAPAIAWCQENISRSDSRCTFRHMDVRNGMYNPGGTTSAASYCFPKAGPFDVILLKSVFTHMLHDEVANYLAQFPQLLKAKGRCLATFFLLGEHQRCLAAEGRNTLRFEQFDGGSAFVANRVLPEGIVAYEEEDVRSILRRSGLQLAAPVMYGTWTGDRSGLTHQDVLVIERA